MSNTFIATLHVAVLGFLSMEKAYCERILRSNPLVGNGSPLPPYPRLPKARNGRVYERVKTKERQMKKECNKKKGPSFQFFHVQVYSEAGFHYKI